MKIRIRRGTSADHGLIQESWWRTAARASGLDMGSIVPALKPTITRILAKPSTEVWVAEDTEVVDRVSKQRWVHGYVVLDSKEEILHFAFTKRESRQFGVCKTLMNPLPRRHFELPPRCWFLTRDAKYVARCLPSFALLYDPLCLLEV